MQIDIVISIKVKQTKYMKKIIYSILILNLFSHSLIAQSYNKSPISPKDFVDGVMDFNYFRAILLEKGFNFDEGDNNIQFWKVLIDDSQYLCQLCIQMSVWKHEGKVFKRQIFLQVRHDLLPEYTNELLKLVKDYFPQKNAIPITRTYPYRDNEPKQDYELQYSNPTTDVYMIYEQKNDTWTSFQFSKDYDIY